MLPKFPTENPCALWTQTLTLRVMPEILFPQALGSSLAHKAPLSQLHSVTGNLGVWEPLPPWPQPAPFLTQAVIPHFHSLMEERMEGSLAPICEPSSVHTPQLNAEPHGSIMDNMDNIQIIPQRRMDLELVE